MYTSYVLTIQPVVNWPIGWVVWDVIAIQTRFLHLLALLLSVTMDTLKTISWACTQLVTDGYKIQRIWILNTKCQVSRYQRTCPLITLIKTNRPTRFLNLLRPGFIHRGSTSVSTRLPSSLILKQKNETFLQYSRHRNTKPNTRTREEDTSHIGRQS